MKRCFLGLMIVALCALSPVYAKTRIFTDKEGRSIEAELVGYNGAESKVTIRRKGAGRAITVPIASFSEPDQKYIYSWGLIHDFQSRNLQADLRRMQDTVSQRSTDASTQVNTEHWFKAVFENNTRTSFKDLEVEYVLYYFRITIPIGATA